MSTKELLSKNHFQFNKNFGQNFILDTNFLASLVTMCKMGKETEVLEIGTGAGTLTREIARSTKKVVTYEIDKKLTEILSESLKDIPNCKLVMSDIMRKDIDEIESDFTSNYTIFANLPYYITTPIIFKFLYSNKLDEMFIMVQKEVANRIVAKAGSSDYGILSIIIDSVANTEIIKVVDRKMFVPSPNVDSALVRITKVQKFQNLNPEEFSRFVHSAMSMRRKTLTNNLNHAYSVSRDTLVKIIAPHSPNIRGEQLSVSDYVEIYGKMKQLKLIDQAEE